MARCGFKEAWGGDCGSKTQMLDKFCPTHLGTACAVCGGQAEIECSAPGPEGHACGFPLCITPACTTEHFKKWHPK